MLTSSRSVFFGTLLGLSISATLLPACGRGPLVCYGGGRQVGSACYCAKGQTWNGSQCTGTPETGNCAQKNAMEVVGATGSMCFCPDGWIWTDGNRTECVACTGGAVANGDTNCVCPEGTAWVDNACQVQQQQIVEQAPAASCSGGSIATDQGCQCPQGTGWDGSNCVGLQEAPQQQQVIRQRSIQSSSSFTCCVNHAKYTCPNDAAFQACATMQPSHGCARAGGC